ncbi:hypothetical protein [Sphingomonas japonica]|uniref:hypothetical protein n=1 Tax=Sphingomonas japonica TaxID=511662 RepID=UPI001ABB8B32|nr:hypothetical protein [Sphingomonas japonica]
MLIESLIHGLVARSLISGEDAVEIIGTASEVNDELAQETDLPAITAQQAHTLLSDIAASLSIELPDRADRPR